VLPPVITVPQPTSATNVIAAPTSTIAATRTSVSATTLLPVVTAVPQPILPTTVMPVVRDVTEAEIRAVVATTPANISDLSLPVFVNNELPRPDSAAPMIIQTENEVTVQVVTVNEQVVTVSDETGFRLAVAAVDESGEPMKIAADGALIVPRDNWISIVGSGLRPNSTAVAWVFSEPRRLGVVQVAPDGTFRERFRVPEDLPEGDHTTQVNGFDADGQVRSFNLAIEVREPIVALTPSGLGQETATSDPADRSVVASVSTRQQNDSRAAYALIALLLLGGAVFFANGLRLKNRDISNGIIRPAYIRDTTGPTPRPRPSTYRRATSTPQRRAAQPRLRTADDTGEIYLG